MSFTPSGAKKIAQATREFIRKPKNQSARGKRESSYSDGGRHAKITGKTGAKYDWIAVKPTEEGWEEMPSWGRGISSESSGYAMEVEHRSEWVLTDSIVWLEVCVELNCYLFEYNGGVQVGRNNSYITPRFEDNPGSGSVTVQVPPETGFAWEDADIVDVINPFGEIAGDNWVQITYGRGIWQVTGVGCES